MSENEDNWVQVGAASEAALAEIEESRHRVNTTWCVIERADKLHKELLDQINDLMLVEDKSSPQGILLSRLSKIVSDYEDVRFPITDTSTGAPWDSVARDLGVVIPSLRLELSNLRSLCSAVNEEICQTLGKVLNFPWFKDNQEIFPGATEADGVCVAELVAEDMAAIAATRINTLTIDAEHAARRIKTLEAALAPFAAIPPVEYSICNKDGILLGWSNPVASEAAHYWCVVGSPSKTHFTREDLAAAMAALPKSDDALIEEAGTFPVECWSFLSSGATTMPDGTAEFFGSGGNGGSDEPCGFGGNGGGTVK